MKCPDLYGLVLIGGESTRMGTDKSLLRYHKIDQRQFSYKLLSSCCTKTFLSCSRKQADNVEYPFIVDTETKKGPLAGLLSAFTQHPNVAWLVLACDMPHINKQVIQMLVEHRDPEKLATCFYHNFPEPLCTIWEPAAYKLLQEFIATGNFSPRHFLENNAVNYIRVDETFKHHLANLNTPQEQKRTRL